MPARVAWCFFSHARHSARDAGVTCANLVFVVIGIVLGGGGIELPAFAVAIRNLLLALQLFVVLVHEADGPADVVDDVLIGCWIVSPWRLVSDGRGRLPIGVDIAAGNGRTRVRMFRKPIMKLTPSAACRGCGAVEIQG